MHKNNTIGTKENEENIVSRIEKNIQKRSQKILGFSVFKEKSGQMFSQNYFS